MTERELAVGMAGRAVVWEVAFRKLPIYFFIF
jgi:hypothetical protein